MRNLKFILSLAFFSFLTSACSTSPLGRNQLMMMPDDTMNQMGVQAFEETKKQTPVEHDAAINRYVQCIVRPLTQNVTEHAPPSWEIVVFKDDKTVNAFALPGGKVGVYTGILKVANTPGQLAAVVGHEIGHVIAGHSNERVSQANVGQIADAAFVAAFLNKKNPNYMDNLALLGVTGLTQGVLLKFSRDQESEADLIGLDLMAKSGFDPREAVTLWENMSRASSGEPWEWISTHPSNERRIRDISARVAQEMPIYQASSKPNCRR